jgi:YD repeat-containing protein
MPKIDLGLVRGEDAFDAQETAASFDYEPDGTLTAIHESMPAGDTRSTVFVYDDMRRLITATQTHGTTPRTYTYTYDAAGKLVSVDIAIETP